MILELFRRKEQPRRRRSLENPNTSLSDPDVWLQEAWGGGPSSSGISVNSETATTYSPVFRAVNLISNSVAKIPICTYKRAGMGKTKDTAHPSFSLLRYQPSPNLNFFVWKWCMQAQALLQGNGYSEIRRVGNSPVAIEMLSAAHVKPVVSGREVVYVVNGGTASARTIARKDVIHIRGFGDGIVGTSIITKARESLGLGMAAQKFGSVFFKNGARPSAALEHPGTLGDEAARNLRLSWEALHTGDIENRHKIAILEEGMKLNVFQMSNEDAQFLQTRQFEIREVANWFGVPPHKLGDTTRTAYASLEQENQAFLDDSLDPWLVCWEAELRDKLLTEEEKAKDSHAIEFLRQAIARANMADRSAFYSSALLNGWMSRDEVRARENLNPIPDGEGEGFYIPLNVTVTGEEEPEPPPGAGAAAPPDPPPAPPAPAAGGEEDSEKLDDALRQLVAELFVRAIKRAATVAKRHAKDPAKFVDWADGPAADDLAGMLRETGGAVARVLEASGRERALERMAFAFRDAALEALVEATQAKPEDLDRAVAAGFEKLERSAPVSAAGEIVR